ncbi:MAG: lipoprotein [Moraxella sp.]|nr:lipoprotein [Moraxella sp.]
MKAFFSAMPKVACVMMLVFLSACGQKGALYLPENAPTPTPKLPTAASQEVTP